MSTHSGDSVVFFSVLYNPENNALDNLRKANHFGFKSIVYINKVSQHFFDELRLLNVVILGDGQNVGLGKAFCALEKYLEKTDFRYYLYFDQDTLVQENAWLEILGSFQLIYSNSTKIYFKYF